MAFIELSHIKNILGITDDSEDMRISVILVGILVKVSLLIKRERTKLIPAHNVENFEIPIPCPLISEILTIDGKKYDNVVILENGKIFVENFFPSKKFFEVKFISGVEKCPAKIVSLVASLIELEL